MRPKWGNRLLSCAFAAGLTACATQQPVYYSDTPPPPQQYERWDNRPGFVWSGGYWQHVGGDWRWRPGEYVPERQGQAFRPGGWVREGNRWHFREGYWVSGTTGPEGQDVIIRDHRTDQPVQTQPIEPNQPPPTVVVPSRDPH